MADTVQDVCISVRALLNDREQGYADDEFLLPLLAMVYRILQQKLAEGGRPMVKGTVDLVLPAGDAEFIRGAVGELPADFISPIELQERKAASAALVIAAAPAGAIRASNVVTIKTSLAHSFQAGRTVVIAGVTNSSFNGTFTVASIVDADEFTYAQTAANATSGEGTATMQATRFVPMHRLLLRVPDEAPYDELYYWLWQDQQIKFIASTIAQDVRLTYEKQLANLTLTSTGNQIVIDGARDQLAMATAGLAARSRGVGILAADLAQMAKELGKIILNRDALSDWARLEPAKEEPEPAKV